MIAADRGALMCRAESRPKKRCIDLRFLEAGPPSHGHRRVGGQQGNRPTTCKRKRPVYCKDIWLLAESGAGSLAYLS